MGTESWSSRKRKISLKPFQEITGHLEAYLLKDGRVTIQLSSGTIQYDSDSVEAGICGTVLAEMEGSFVSILATPILNKPLRVKVEERKDTTSRPGNTPVGEDSEEDTAGTTQLALDDPNWNHRARIVTR